MSRQLIAFYSYDGSYLDHITTKGSGEYVGGVESLAGEVLPVGFRQDLGVGLALPEYRQVLALGVVFQAGEIDKRLFPRTFMRRLDGFNQVSPASNLYNLSK